MPIASPETTELERRVLAHERILQALIAYMARTEPRFVDHLRERFVEPMSMAGTNTTTAKPTICGRIHTRRDAPRRSARAKGEGAGNDQRDTRARSESSGAKGSSMNRPAQRSGVQVSETKRHLGGAGRRQVPRRLPPEGTCSCRCGLAQIVAPMTSSTHPTLPQDFAIQVAENEGMPTRPNSRASPLAPAPTRRLTGTLTLGLSRTRAATGGLWSAKDKLRKDIPWRG